MKNTGPHDDAKTRERVASLILHQGPATAAEIAEKLELTPAAVRRHLDHLLESGLIETKTMRQRGQRGRGRPAKKFQIADSSRDQFGHQYDLIASSALDVIRERLGDEAVREFAERRVADFESNYGSAMNSYHPSERPAMLAEMLSDEGYAATITENTLGTQICQHHCPVAHVAKDHPELCEAETQMFSRLLGTHVQRLATIAHGDGVCTTHIPQENH